MFWRGLGWDEVGYGCGTSSLCANLGSEMNEQEEKGLRWKCCSFQKEVVVGRKKGLL